VNAQSGAMTTLSGVFTGESFVIKYWPLTETYNITSCNGQTKLTATAAVDVPWQESRKIF